MKCSLGQLGGVEFGNCEILAQGGLPEQDDTRTSLLNAYRRMAEKRKKQTARSLNGHPGTPQLRTSNECKNEILFTPKTYTVSFSNPSFRSLNSLPLLRFRRSLSDLEFPLLLLSLQPLEFLSCFGSLGLPQPLVDALKVVLLVLDSLKVPRLERGFVRRQDGVRHVFEVVDGGVERFEMGLVICG